MNMIMSFMTPRKRLRMSLASWSSLSLSLLVASACTGAEPPQKPRPADEPDMARGLDHDLDQDVSDMTPCQEPALGAIRVAPSKVVDQAPPGIYRCAVPDMVTDVYTLCDYGGASAQARGCQEVQTCPQGCSPYDRRESSPNPGEFCAHEGLPPGQIVGRLNRMRGQWILTGRLMHRVSGAVLKVVLDEGLEQAVAGVEADLAILDDQGCRVGLLSSPASAGQVTPLVSADGALLGVQASVTVMHQGQPETIEATIPVIP